MLKESPKARHWLDRRIFPEYKLTWEIGLLGSLLILAVVSRFYGLGDRVMSHDETTHVVFSWQLSQGSGYTHDPLTHGPLQFHLIGLSYFLFGDNDFTARAPAALFGVFTVLLVWWGFRRYLGRVGALIAAFLFLISPYMLYYSRYARNESWVAFFGLLTIWGMLRYLDRGENKYIYVATTALALHFAAKETSFIYAAQALIFLGLLFLARIGRSKWREAEDRQRFFSLLLVAAGALFLGVVVLAVASKEAGTLAGSFLLALALVSVAASLFFLVRGYGLEVLRRERSFALVVILFAVVLPNLGAFLLSGLGRVLNTDLSYSYFKNTILTMNWGQFLQSPASGNVLILVLVILVMFGLSALAGWLWNFRQWSINIGIFFLIFVPLFTTMFTNPVLGTFTGLIGSLAYWLEQQAVERGSQPSYFYWAVQIPVYEFLGALGSFLAAGLGFGIWRRERTHKAKKETETRNLMPAESRRIALWLFAFWAVSALAAYTIAGEKMPWLTVHIALPLLMLAGWALGWVIRRVDWARFASWRGVAMVAAMAVAGFVFLDVMGILMGSGLPFQGMEQFQIQATLRFVFTVLLLLGSSGLLVWLVIKDKWPDAQVRRTFVLLTFAGLAVLTARAAFRAAYLNYDSATEYLVYAHMARGPKEMMEQLEELSLRLTDGLDIRVAYDNESNYPLWWYLRNYPNKLYYDVNPSLNLRDYAVIIAGDPNYNKIDPIVRDDYYVFQFQRIWWPNQDYFEFQKKSLAATFAAETGRPTTDMSYLEYLPRLFGRIGEYIDTPEEREALFDVWLNRDFTNYLTLRGRDPSPSAWSPAASMRMYVRKDIAAQIWDLGAPPAALAADPYEGKSVSLPLDMITGDAGSGEGQFNSPRGLAVAPDGSLYVADSFNHRIQHLDADGLFINAWGVAGDPVETNDPEGAFSEPWGVAVSPDGRFVYVADTWNYRIQKFTASGAFVTMWGTTEQTGALYGPRDILVANDGNVIVTDTGNKRIIIYDANGNYVSQIGGSGFELGQFEEPVGLALDREANLLFVADAWNLRVQVLSYQDGLLNPLRSWDIESWEGQSITNKPYLAVGSDHRVYVTDPDLGRVLVFEQDGTFVHFFGGYTEGEVNIGIAQGITADDSGGLWVSDSLGNRLYHFVIEAE
ncbi:MAG: flippase activity-associated protein Agl23 [Anaerolineales bacterium]